MIQPSGHELIDRFRDAVALRFGLQFDDGKRDFLGEVLMRHAGRPGGAEAAAYVNRLSSGQATRTEFATLAADLTIGETYFFRHPDQFRAFTDALLRGGQSPSGHRRLHVLSAGCASGEEAYSLAILLRQHVPDASEWDLRIVGIDLNPASLAKAVQGRYTVWSLRGGSDDLRQRYFHPVDRDYQLDASVRTMVTFEQRNLLDEAPDFWRPGAYDAIFCRNVMMYFTPEAARGVVARFTRALTPGGYLFLGPVETLRGLSNDYHLRHTHDTFYYQRRLTDEPALQPLPDEAGRPRSPDDLLPAMVAGDDSWVTAIDQASERIARLSQGLRSTPPSTRQPVSPHRGEPVVAAAPNANLVAREMLRQERYADALLALGSTAGEQARDPDAKLLRAAILTNCGQPAEAERLCEEILAGDELNAEARYVLALCREHAGAYEVAAEQDRTAIYLDPQFAMPHLHLGLLSKRAGDRENARRAFRHASTLFPREDAARVLLFGGGFSREMLIRLCEAELRAYEGGE